MPEPGEPRPIPKLWKWIALRTDWLAVISCIPLSVGLILYCVPVSEAHGDTQELLRIAGGGQSSLSWLATVYAVTLGITLPLSIIGILYSLLVVAASIYAHRHVYLDDPSTQWQKAQQPPPQQQQQQQQQGRQSSRLSLPWRSCRSISLPRQADQQQQQQQPTGSFSGGQTSAATSRSGSMTQLHQLQAPSLTKSASLPNVALAPGAPPAAPLPDLAQTLKGDKGQAGGLWERALGLAMGPPGMQSVLTVLAGGQSRDLLGQPAGPPPDTVVDITRLKSPIHRRLPSMSLSAPLGGLGPSQQPAEGAAGSTNGSGRLRPKRLTTEESKLSEVEEIEPSSSAAARQPSRKGTVRSVRWAKTVAAVQAVRPLLSMRRRTTANGAAEGQGAREAAAAAGGARVAASFKSSGSPGEELQLQQEGAALRVYRALRWMLLTLIAANSVTLVWLVILVVATSAWLVCSEAVEEVANDTLALSSTAMGAANDALGLTQQNQAAVSIFSQLFGMEFLQQVNNASGGVYNFTSYQQLQDVAGESAGTLGAAAVTAYSTAVSDDGVISLVAPQFDASGSATLDGVILPCPSSCLNFRYFNFLESGACVCEPDTIQRVAVLAGQTVDGLAVALAGLALMILSVLVLLLRFAMLRGQVQARWALRHAVQVYAKHQKETLMRRRYRSGRQVAPTNSW